MAQFIGALRNGGVIGYTSNVLAQRRAAKNALDLQKEAAMAGIQEGINTRAANAADQRQQAAEERAAARKRADFQTMNEAEIAAENRKWGRTKEENAGGFDFAKLLQEQQPMPQQQTPAANQDKGNSGGTVTTDTGTYPVNGEAQPPQGKTKAIGDVFTIDPATGQLVMNGG